ncbi:hypothetical protein ACH3XW_4915 [Acanthocheilonema viteae]
MENNPSLKGQGSSGAFNRVHVRVRLITVTPTRAYLLLANVFAFMCKCDVYLYGCVNHITRRSLLEGRWTSCSCL